jgi:hypothetical protein
VTDHVQRHSEIKWSLSEFIRREWCKAYLFVFWCLLSLILIESKLVFHWYFFVRLFAVTFTTSHSDVTAVRTFCRIFVSWQREVQHTGPSVTYGQFSRAHSQAFATSLRKSCFNSIAIKNMLRNFTNCNPEHFRNWLF